MPYVVQTSTFWNRNATNSATNGGPVGGPRPRASTRADRRRNAYGRRGPPTKRVRAPRNAYGRPRPARAAEAGPGKRNAPGQLGRTGGGRGGPNETPPAGTGGGWGTGAGFIRRPGRSVARPRTGRCVPKYRRGRGPSAHRSGRTRTTRRRSRGRRDRRTGKRHGFARPGKQPGNPAQPRTPSACACLGFRPRGNEPPETTDLQTISPGPPSANRHGHHATRGDNGGQYPRDDVSAIHRRPLSGTTRATVSPTPSVSDDPDAPRRGIRRNTGAKPVDIPTTPRRTHSEPSEYRVKTSIRGPLK